MTQHVNSQAIIDALTTQIGQLTTQVIMRDLALSGVEQEIEELRAAKGSAEGAAKDVVFEKAPAPKPVVR